MRWRGRTRGCSRSGSRVGLQGAERQRRPRHVRGEFVGVFDADHHPEPGAFQRAWRWLASTGTDVVQGHCSSATDAHVSRDADSWRWSSRLSTPSATRAGRAPRVRHLRRLERLLAHRAARPDPYARVHAARRTSTPRCGWSAGGTIASIRGSSPTELAPTGRRPLDQRCAGLRAGSRSRFGIFAQCSGVRAPRSAAGSAPSTCSPGVRCTPGACSKMFPLLAFWLLRGDPATNWLVPVFVAHRRCSPSARARPRRSSRGSSQIRRSGAIPDGSWSFSSRRFSSTPRSRT